jgi:hypothetical protein
MHEEGGIDKHLDPLYPTPVLRVFFLCDEEVDLAQRVTFRRAVTKIDNDVLLRTSPDKSWDCSERNNPNRGNSFPKQGIEKGTLSSFELTQNSKLELALFPPFAKSLTQPLVFLRVQEAEDIFHNYQEIIGRRCSGID